jgi:competence ComEA-like helix-hairpin-helix protein
VRSKREYETNENRRNKRKVGSFSFVSSIFVCLVFSLHTVASQQKSEERININTAFVEELTRLPGIGPELAKRIVEFRRKHGPFKRPQDIIVVRGMSANRYRQISHLICI